MSEYNIIIDNIKNFRIINEGFNRSDFASAIRNHDILYIYYEGDNTISKGYRTIEPYALGVTSKGNLALRAWQQAGASDTNLGIKTPYSPLRRGKNITTTSNWRLFLVDKITSAQKTFEKFPPYGEDFRPGYNPNDEQLYNIIVAVDPKQKLEPEISGTGSVDDPNIAFGPQTDKLKIDLGNLTSKQSQINLRQFVKDKFEIIRKYHKKSPNNYQVVKTPDKYLVKPLDYQLKNDEEMLGNLGNMKRNYDRLENMRKADTSFEDKERRDFFDKERKRQKK